MACEENAFKRRKIRGSLEMKVGFRDAEENRSKVDGELSGWWKTETQNWLEWRRISILK
jgi:hypothetical protein